MRKSIVILVAAALTLAVGACSGDDDDSSSTNGGGNGSGIFGQGKDDKSDPSTTISQAVNGGDDQGDSQDGSGTGSGSGDGGYTDSTHATFVGQCTAHGGRATQSTCECAWKQITQNVPYATYHEFDQQAQTDPSTPIPSWLTAAVSACT